MFYWQNIHAKLFVHFYKSLLRLAAESQIYVIIGTQPKSLIALQS